MTLRRRIRALRNQFRLTAEARSARRQDRRGLPAHAVDSETAVREGLAWLCRAQDRSASQDGGVARHFSLIDGWSHSYPETTGYIVPTMLEYARVHSSEDARTRAKRMLDWLVSIQFPGGGFQCGMVHSQPRVPVIFNTGQILIGLAGGVREYGAEYRDAMHRAADWLVETQDPDGCWRRHATPLAAPGEKAYETHVSWGMFEAARLDDGKRYENAALTNIGWALRFQRPNGWFDNCCLSDPARPLTHTIGYALRGIVEAYRYTRDETLLRACMKTAEGLLGSIRLEDGFLPGRLDSQWNGVVPWACLTGTVQIAACWFLLFRYSGKLEYREAALAANRYVRRTMITEGPAGVRGGIKGAFPVSGGYGAYRYLNWACKFFVDSHLLEQKIEDR